MGRQWVELAWEVFLDPAPIEDDLVGPFGKSRMTRDVWGRVELVAFNKHGDLAFPRLCRRMLNSDRIVPVPVMIFVLHVDGADIISPPYSKRRQLDLNGLRRRLRTRPRRRRRQMAPLDLPAGCARLDQDQELLVLEASVGSGTVRSRDERCARTRA